MDGIPWVFLACTVIALPKPNTIGEISTKSTVCIQKIVFQSYFTPIQHGIAMPGGAELLIHHIQLLLEFHPEWSVLKTDVKMLLTMSLEIVYCNKLLRVFLTSIIMLIKYMDS